MRRWVGVFGPVLVAALCTSAAAENDRPAERPLEPPQYLEPDAGKPDGFVLPPVPEAKPGAPEAGGAAFVLKDLRFEGNQAIATEVLHEQGRNLLGQRVTGAELEELRIALTRLYIQQGFINSGAVLPADAVKDGVVTFRIIEGRLSEIRISGNERLREGYIREKLDTGSGPLNVNALQDRFQVLLADPLFAKVNARLLPGLALGESILDVGVTRARPYQLYVQQANTRPPSVDETSTTIGGWVRNLTGLGELIDYSYSDSDGGSRESLGLMLPLNGYGTELTWRIDDGASTVLEEPLNRIDVRSTIKSQEIGISHPFLERADRRFVLGLSYAKRETQTSLLGIPFSFTPGENTGTSRLSVTRFWQDYVRRWEKQVVALRSTFSFGRNNQNEDTGGAPIVIPAARYALWLGQAQYAHRLLDNDSQLVVRADYQIARDTLLPLERMAIGGVRTVRGYRENQMTRDNGYVLSAEFQYPLPSLGGFRLTVAPFLDHGSGWNRVERQVDTLRSSGIALYARWGGLSADLVYARRHVDVVTSGGDSLQDKGVHFQVRYDMF